jgi:outer membrane protein OmpA-like peptidoglycan-associated protein
VRRSTHLALICAVGGAVLACSPAPTGGGSAEIALESATKYIVRAYQRYPLVALSEMHGNAESQALFTAVVRDPDFQAVVSDIVVEFGNGRFQGVVDRYLAGENVRRDELMRVWRETTQISGIFDLPMYEAMLTTVRNVNASLPPARKLRVWLGDPPIDWSTVTSPADEDMNDWRDAFFARVVDDQIRKRGRTALLFIGGAHIGRKVIFPNSLIHLLDARRPGETLVVSVLDMGGVTPAVATRLRDWSPGVAATIRGTWLGRMDVKEVGFRFSRGALEQDVDALALLTHSALAYAPPPTIDRRTSYGAELERRRRLAAATGPFRGGEIRFAHDQPTLLPEAREPLEAILAELRRDRGLKLLVKAFADGREQGPAPLSTRRAHVVIEWLVARGIQRDRFSALGCGTVRPLTFGETEGEQTRNRRAELVRQMATAGCEPPW